jgi:antitoxin HicB
MKKRNDVHTGGSFGDYLQDSGALQEAEAVAIKRVLAWQLEEARRASHLTKRAMAQRLRTSRSQLERLFDPDNAGVTLGTMVKAANVVGKRIEIRVVNSRKRGVHHRKRILAVAG